MALVDTLRAMAASRYCAVRAWILREAADAIERHGREVDEFNAGYECANNGGKPDDEPTEGMREDHWQIGFAWRQIDDLRALVAKLPKTNDGVPIVPNEHYWLIFRDGPKQVLVEAITHDRDGVWCNYRDSANGPGAVPEDFYSSREAALAQSI